VQNESGIRDCRGLTAGLESRDRAIAQAVRITTGERRDRTLVLRFRIAVRLPAMVRHPKAAALRRNFDAAIADGVFGVPSIVSEGVVFWGADATAMFEDFLDDPALVSSAEMRRLEALPVGAARKSRA
jgi:hypothetical protein